MPFNLSTDDILNFIRAKQDYAPLIIFLMALGETIIVVSIFIPSTFLLIAIGGLMAASGVPLLPSLLAGALGASLGFSLMYILSATMQGRILTMWPVRNYSDIVARAQDFTRRWGVVGVFLGHFMGPIRVIIPIVAGLSRMPPSAFMAANIVGSFGWICVFFAPSHLLISSEWFRTHFAESYGMIQGLLPLPK
ncbi:MAG: DedA family protein [Methylobacterium sp.]|jgi:membrane protein DedA with SNARE-associated domain|nr:DedA family protein [Methylobacterium sp.]MCA3601483.1 DedA family protein [Methylobacterium sp.]MCA3604801.1 DedA family protein [Methylobacterium sp.]MCA3607759.1 DedA family protein [Methylobacterium sp.]MCA3609829.1 DedA family protein [Methylobacterium sp.]